jgi:hypothetical protein
MSWFEDGIGYFYPNCERTIIARINMMLTRGSRKIHGRTFRLARTAQAAPNWKNGSRNAKK